MAFMKDILTHNIPIWEECAATPFVQEVQTGKLPLEKFKRYMIQDSIYLKNYARIYGKAIFHAATLREIQLYYSMLNFVNDTESEVRLDYLKQFCITDDDIELIAPLPENQNYIDFMFEIASHGKNEEILMAVLPCMLSYSYIFRKLAAVPTSRQSRYWDFIKDYPALIRKILMGQAVPFLLQSLPSLQREKVFRLQSNLQRLMSQWQSNTLLRLEKAVARRTISTNCISMVYLKNRQVQNEL